MARKKRPREAAKVAAEEVGVQFANQRLDSPSWVMN